MPRKKGLNGDAGPPVSRQEARTIIQRAAKTYAEAVEGMDPSRIEAWLAMARVSQAGRAAIKHKLDNLDLDVSMSSVRFSVLRALYFSTDKQLQQYELGVLLSVSRTLVTTLIDGLQIDGLVVRVNNSLDRRANYARLTPAGEALVTEVLPIMSNQMSAMSSRLTGEERETLIQLIFKMYEGITGFEEV